MNNDKQTEYGIGTFWRINIRFNEDVYLYTGKILEEDDTAIKIYTIKDETRILNKRDIVGAIQQV